MSWGFSLPHRLSERLSLARPLLTLLLGESTSMKKKETRQVKIVTAAEARQALTSGDLRSDVAFQNDINTLLACLEEKQPALRALAGPMPPVPRRFWGALRRGRLRDRGPELLAKQEVVLAHREPQELPQRLVRLSKLA
jgi:hypothetical protein